MDIKTELPILDKNLYLIKNYNSKLVEKILNIQEITKPVEFLEAKSGDPVFSYNGLLIDVEIDPIDWAYQIFYKLNDNDEDNIYVIFGMGLGYVFKRFVQSCKGKIILFEPNIEILRLSPFSCLWTRNPALLMRFHSYFLLSSDLHYRFEGLRHKQYG